MNLPCIRRSQHQFVFDAAAKPGLRVASGSTIVVETLDCFSNKITSASQRFEFDADVLDLVGAYNPVSRPIYVTGAEPGDTLAVRIDRIDLGPVEPYAVMVVTRDTALLCGRRSRRLASASDTRICALEDGHVLLPAGPGLIRHPVRPMVGAIGTAPSADPVSSLHYAPGCGGNLDCPDITIGASVLLPVNVPGGLLSLGDVHALMGDGEIAGVALETHADVTLTVELLKAGTRAPAARPASAGPLASPGPAESASLPRLDTPHSLGTIGCSSHESVDANIAAALDDVLGRLCDEFGLRAIEAYQIIGAVGRIRVNQCVHYPGQGWCTSYVSVPRSALPGGAHWVGAA